MTNAGTIIPKLVNTEFGVSNNQLIANDDAISNDEFHENENRVTKHPALRFEEPPNYDQTNLAVINVYRDKIQIAKLLLHDDAAGGIAIVFADGHVVDIERYIYFDIEEKDPIVEALLKHHCDVNWGPPQKGAKLYHNLGRWVNLSDSATFEVVK